MANHLAHDTISNRPCLGLLLLVIAIHRLSAGKDVPIRKDKSAITLDGVPNNWDDIYATVILEKYRSVYLTVVLRAFDLFLPIALIGGKGDHCKTIRNLLIESFGAQVYLAPDALNVIKVNDAVYYATWEEYFNSVVLS